MEQEKLLAWHFVQDDGRTAYGNMLVEAGKTYSTDETPVLCETGFHASERLLDALMYAPGGIVCRVEVWGDIKRGDDKLAARNRRVLWMLDINRLLHEFACDVAEETLLQHGITDERAWNAIHVKRAWLAGKAANNELDAARAAAGDAARAAAASAIRAAAWDAARAAAWAAWDAARAAARAAALAALAAAWAAAWAAARAAAGDAARAAAGDAARAAAGDAAWDAARADLNARLEARVLQAAAEIRYLRADRVTDIPPAVEK